MARRYAPQDDRWERVEALLPGRKKTAGVIAKDNRLFVGVVPYRYPFLPNPLDGLTGPQRGRAPGKMTR